jgi:hypothetical protein
LVSGHAYPAGEYITKQGPQSIPQTRQHFQNIVLGIDDADADVAWREEWEVEERERERSVVASPRSAKGKEREKRRVSLGVQ